MPSSDLMPDAAATRSALTGFATAMKAINNYCAAISGIQLGPFNIAGSEVDLFANFPVLKANLLLAQQHATTLAEQDFLIKILVGLGSFQATFKSTTNSILAAIASGQPTAGFLNSLLEALDPQAAITAQAHSALATFSNQLSTDKANLSQGASDIPAAVHSIQQWVVRESEQVLAGPGGAGIVATIASIGKQLTDGLGGMLTSIETVIPENEAAGAGAAALMVVWNTLRGKYQDLIDELTKAGTHPEILQPGDLHAAQLAWQELVAFAESLF